MAITFDDAEAYFSEDQHVKAAIWAEWPEASRRAAILHARRLLSRALKREMSDTEAAYVEGDETRDEYAVYEQALWCLEQGMVANATGTGPKWMATAGDKAPATPRHPAPLLAPEALRWLGAFDGGVTTSRG